MEKRTCRHDDGCPRPARKLGWCSMHYERMRKYGKPGPAERTTTWGESKGKTCSVDGCGDGVRVKGMCMFHYGRVRHTGDVGGERKRRHLPQIRDYTPGERHRFYKYGLTPEAFDEMLASQGGRCYICGTDKPNGKGWSVDHCHETNAVRFIACNPCNAAFGLIHEDPDIAKRMWEVAVESQARKGAEVRVADLVEWAISAHRDLVEDELRKDS